MIRRESDIIVLFINIHCLHGVHIMKDILDGLEYQQVAVIGHDSATTSILVHLPVTMYNNLWTDHESKVVVVCEEPKVWARRCCALVCANAHGKLEFVDTVAGRKSEEVGQRIGFVDCEESDYTISTRILYTTIEKLVFDLANQNDHLQISVLILDYSGSGSAESMALNQLVLFHSKTKLLPDHPRMRLVVSCDVDQKEMLVGYFNGVKRVVSAEIVGARPEVNIVYFENAVNIQSTIDCIVVLINDKNKLQNGNVVVFVASREMGDSISRQIKDRQVYSFYAGRAELHHGHYKHSVLITTGFIPDHFSVRFVIDCGWVKRRRFDSVGRMYWLTEERVSFSEAEQRLRSVNEEHGECHRVYSRDLSVTREPPSGMIDPTMLIIFLLKLGYSQPLDCELINPINYGLEAVIPYLVFSDIISEQGVLLKPQITTYNLPLPYALMLEQGRQLECFSAVAKIVSVLMSCKQSNKRLVLQRNDNLILREGDLLAMLNIFSAFLGKRTARWCTMNGFNFDILDRASRLYDRITNATSDKQVNDRNVAAILQCITVGLFMNVAVSKKGSDHYKCARTGRPLWTHPDSFLFPRLPLPCVVYDEAILGNGKVYIKYISAVSDFEWLTSTNYWHSKLSKRNINL